MSVCEVKTISQYVRKILRHYWLFSLSFSLKYTIEFSRSSMMGDGVITLVANGMCVLEFSKVRPLECSIIFFNL